MFELLRTMLIGLATLVFLILVHEMGHYLMARFFYIPMRRFSIGFGKPLWSWSDKHGTVFSFAPWLLGGYVEFISKDNLKEDEGVAHQFSHFPPFERIIVMLAGPFANVLLAFVLFLVLSLMPQTNLRSVLGVVPEGSYAAEAGLIAGDEIVAVDEVFVVSWGEFYQVLAGHAGEPAVKLVYSREGAPLETTLLLGDFLVSSEEPSFDELGLQLPFLVAAPSLSSIEAGSPAQAAGLEAGMQILAVDDVAIPDVQTFISVVAARPNETLLLEVQTADGTPSVMSVAVGEQDGKGWLGVQIASPVIPPELFFEQTLNFTEAIKSAFHRLNYSITLILKTLKKMIFGEISLDYIASPVRIFSYAGDSLAQGLKVFVSFVALLSINLGILNLIPLPMLDGGQIVLVLIESVRGKPLREQTRLWLLRISLVLLVLLLVVALSNDISYFFGR